MSSKDSGKVIERVEKLDVLHGVKPEQLEAFIAATGLKELIDQPLESYQLADLFCGNAIAAKILFNALSKLRSPITINCIDVYNRILQTAQMSLQKELEDIRVERGKIKIVTQRQELGLTSLFFPNNELDLVTIKMGLHEVPAYHQNSIIREIYRVLKPGGKFIIWGNFVPKNPLTGQDLYGFNYIVRTKDALAGFDRMKAQRYFTSKEEVETMLGAAGFSFTVVSEWIRCWDSLSRYEFELNSDPDKLAALNRAIDQSFYDPKIKSQFGYQVTQSESGLEGRSFIIPCGIILAEKPVNEQVFYLEPQI